MQLVVRPSLGTTPQPPERSGLPLALSPQQGSCSLLMSPNNASVSSAAPCNAGLAPSSLHRKLWDGRPTHKPRLAARNQSPASQGCHATNAPGGPAHCNIVHRGFCFAEGCAWRRSRPSMQHRVGEPPRRRLSTRLMSRQTMNQRWLEPRCQLSRVGLQLDSAMSLFVIFTGVTSAALWSKASKTAEARP